MRLRHTARLACGLAAALALGVAQAAHQAGVGALDEQVEAWLHLGYDRPAAALAAIDAAARPDAAAQRVLLRARGMVAARAGLDDEAALAVTALRAPALADDPLAAPDAELVLAEQAERRGQSERTIAHARAAAEGYERACGADAEFGRAVALPCDHRTLWAARVLLVRRAIEDEDLAGQRAIAQSMQVLARGVGDHGLQAWGLANQALAHARGGDTAAARAAIAQSEALGADEARPEQRARVALMRVVALAAYESLDKVERAALQARDHARAAGSPRLAARALANLADIWFRRGRHAEALAAVREALPAARRHDDRRIERVLLHNGALALIGLGRVDEARTQAERLLELWASEGTPGEQASALREVADALADAGHVRLALELIHRERALNEQLSAAQREAAERSLRQRYDRDNERRRIDQLARDNVVAQSELDNQVRVRQLWALAAAVLVGAALLVALLLRRVRATQRVLQSSQQHLRVQSERDALTGVANRRHAQQHLAADGECDGGLLMVDVDHFKRVNDEHGHAAGDEVLIEVARRLQSALREHDLVARWGGEEFLVIAPDIAGADLQELSTRLLRAVSSTPVRLASGSELRVTVSVGHAAFPLGPRGETLHWERALNLVDMALYTAKSLGRHRAVGLQALGDAPDALARAERDFERAWAEGAVRLAIAPGG